MIIKNGVVVKNKFKYLVLSFITVLSIIVIRANIVTVPGKEAGTVNVPDGNCFSYKAFMLPLTAPAEVPPAEFEEEDYGDAPENASGNYPTTIAFNGARHIIVPGIFLGNSVDPEPDGQPGVLANCDDADCLFPSLGDDEDGVNIPSSVSKGTTVTITVTASVNGFLDAWMDFNCDGDWADAGEHIFTSTALVAGANSLSFTVPASASTGQSYARFRFRDYSGPISYDGLVLNGEVEDYKVSITTFTLGNLDFGDAPDPSYPTLLASNGARHTIVPGIHLGNLVDPEPDGQPGIGANCDDLDCLYPSSGDDEDGVIMPSFVIQGSAVNITVSASVNGYLDAWMDFNIDGDWADAGEHIFTNKPLTAGSNNLSFTVPVDAVTGQSYVRFRFRDFSGSISYDGLVSNGEVEDYTVMIQDAQPEYDFGDAPENASGNYPTTIAFNGARHIIVPGIFLGNSVDPEPDGQPGVLANCDDTDCLFPSLGDDEDGVNIPSSVSKGTTVTITVTASVNGYLDAWMDFNCNGDWADAGEHIFTNTSLAAGANSLSFTVPASASTGQSYARFRFRDYSGTISYNGLVLNGEVEDYKVSITTYTLGNLDFGDAPDPSYPTLLASNGARHTIVPGIHLGNLVDPEPDGQPGIGANCDDLDCLYPSSGDDEDGVIMPSFVIQGSAVNITVSASVNGYLDAWMDFNIDGDWADAGEHIFTNKPLTAGSNNLSFTVPVNAVTGQSYVRFRFRDFSGSISYDGLVSNGEVEDYTVMIQDTQPEYDFGDAPENATGNYPTTIAFNGARHIIVPGIFLGNSVDPEPDGQPGVLANCDDTDCLFPSLGDDEDGVNIPSSVSKGTTVTITVTASVNGFLDAWMDFNCDGDWADAGEHIFTNTSLAAGANSLSFTVPASASTGQSYARFRFRDYSGTISYDGLVLNGEVEDYAVSIVLAHIKVDIGVILGGAVLPDWTPGDPFIMDTSLNVNGYLPLTQPYNDPNAIWNYAGTEQVGSIPRSDIVDWVLLELRETSGGPETATSSTTVDKQAVFLLSDGSVVSLDGVTLPEFNLIVTENLYLVVWHRNHLGIMTVNPLIYDGVDTYSYDFTSGSNQAYGGMNAQMEVSSGRYGMIPGDSYPDGQINNLDKTNSWELQAGRSGYFGFDFNLDGQVDNVDKNEWWIPFEGKVIQVP